MPITLSTDAINAINNRDIIKNVECKLYDSKNEYICDLHCENITYSKSRQFGVNSMNLQIINVDKMYTIGIKEIKQDYNILLIEGYDTGIASDKIPTFYGRVKDISHNNSTRDVLNITCYGQLILLQRSDLDKIFIADTVYVDNEKMTPIIDTIAGTIAESEGTFFYAGGVGNFINCRKVRVYSDGSPLLDEIIINDNIYVEDRRMRIVNVNNNPQLDIYPLKNGMIFYSGTNSFTLNEEIRTLDGLFKARYQSSNTYTSITTPNTFITVDNISSQRLLIDGETLVGTSGNTMTIRVFYYMKLIPADDTRSNNNEIFNIGDRIHNGIIDKYRAENNDWAIFKTHNIDIRTTAGDISKEDNYDGYELREELGIIVLNQPVNISERELYASYYYYPKGLFIEDIIRDLVIEPDNFKVDLISNGKFNNKLNNWSLQTDGIASDEYVVRYNNGINITNLVVVSGSDYIGVQQSVSLLEDYEYNLKFNIQGNSGTYKIYINNGYITSGVDFSDIKFNDIKFTSLIANGTYDFEIRLYDLDIDSNVRINDIRLEYNPALINSFTKDKLYCKLSVENGSTPAIPLSGNTQVTPIPRYKTLRQEIRLETDSIELDNTDDLDTVGYVKIDDEVISYSSISGTSLNIDTRGINNSPIQDHVVGKRVYQVLDEGRVWYLPYNNIIPEHNDTTASDYGYTDAIDITASEVTISGADFQEIFYRDGLIITDSEATGVTLKSGIDFTFNQIQSTGIETPYILIDYKKLNTRYDAISEIRSMLAPNYIIDEIIRKNGSVYDYYIRGRYLAQKPIAYYDVPLITDITYNKPSNSYNRVKMFGKQSEPENLMYNNETTVLSINDIADLKRPQYLKGVGYRYLYTTDNEYVYSNSINLQYSNTSDIEITIGETGYRFKRVYTSAGIGKIEILNAKINPVKSMALIKYNGVDNIAGIDMTLHRESSYDVNTIRIYNIYYLTSTVGEFMVGDVLVNGGNSATIKHIMELNERSGYEYVIFVETNSNSSLFTTDTVVTSGTKTATIKTCNIDGVTTQNNYNSSLANYNGKIRLYSIAITDFNEEFSYIPTLNKTHLYINNLEVSERTSRDLWKEELLPISVENDGGQFGNLFQTKYRKMKAYFDNTNIYINNRAEFKGMAYPLRLGNNIVGTVTLERITGEDKREVLWTLNYRNEPNNDIIPGLSTRISERPIFSEQLYNGKLQYVRRDDNNDDSDQYTTDIGVAIRDATHIRFYTRFGHDIIFRTDGGLLYLNKEDIDNANYKPDEIDVKLDGEFITYIPDEYVDSERVPIISRLRNNVVGKRETQVSVVSKLKILGIDLCIIDLGSVKEIGYMDIQGGYLFKPLETNDNDRYDCSFQLSVYYCDKDENFNNIDINDDFALISPDTENIEMSTADMQTLTQSELGEYFKARYIKLRVSTGDEPDITVGTDTNPIEYYGAAISSIAIYNNGILTSEKYIDADVINLYKDTTVYEELNTQEKLDRYTQYNLDEFQKDNNTVIINSPIGTHYEVGMTVNVDDTENEIDENYFIEEVSSTNGAVTLSLGRYE